MIVTLVLDRAKFSGDENIGIVSRDGFLYQTRTDIDVEVATDGVQFNLLSQEPDDGDFVWSVRFSRLGVEELGVYLAHACNLMDKYRGAPKALNKESGPPPTDAQVQQLADAACEADIAGAFASRPEWAADIRRAVDLLHGVATAAEAEYGYQVYAHDGEADA